MQQAVFQHAACLGCFAYALEASKVFVNNSQANGIKPIKFLTNNNKSVPIEFEKRQTIVTRRISKPIDKHY